MKISCDIEITPKLAFEMLCKVVDMDFVLDTNHQYKIKDGKVYQSENGKWECFDDRANLFAALRNVITNLCPNVEFRSDHYIFDFEEEL